MEKVKDALSWSEARKIAKADPLPGSRSLFSVEECTSKLAQGIPYLGVAGNLFWLDLRVWAVANQTIALVEAQAYAKRKFDVLGALKYYAYLDVPAGSTSVAPPSGSPFVFEFEVPVALAATGVSLAEATLGPQGKWRKISGDIQTYAFIEAVSSVMHMIPGTHATKKVLDLLADAARHCPFDVYPFVFSPELEKQLFLKSFQIMENYRKAEEDHAPSAWKICTLFDEARRMSAASSQDVNQALCEFFQSIDFAKGSEYRMENLKNKLAKDCLIFHDRVIVSGLVDLMPRINVELAPKSALDQLSKMVKISQTIAGAFDECDLKDGFKSVIQLLFVRMKNGICAEDISVRSLQRDELPKVIGVVKLARHVLSKYLFVGKAEEALLESVQSPLAGFTARPSSEILMVAKASCKAVHGFVTALYEGKWDHIMLEIAENHANKRRSTMVYAQYPKFRLEQDIEAQYQREKSQQENAAKYASVQETPVSQVSCEEAAAAEAEMPDAGSDDEMMVQESKSDHKETVHKNHRPGSLLLRAPCGRVECYVGRMSSSIHSARKKLERDLVAFAP